MKAKLSSFVLAATLAVAPFQIGCSDDDDDTNFGAGGGAALNAEETFESGDQPLDTAQSSIFDGLGGGSDGTDDNALAHHLANALIYLIEGPDQLLFVLGNSPDDPDAFFLAGEALTANLSFFVQELLCAIGEGTGGVCVEPGQVPDEVLLNLLPSLEALQAALSGEGEGADLSVVLFHIRRLAEGLAESILYLETQSGDAPLITPLFAMLRQAALDIAELLDTIQIVGGGDGDEMSGEEANHALRVTLENLLVNLFTEVLPVAEQDPETAEQIISAIQDGLDQLEEFTGQLLEPIIDGLIDPVTDIIGPILDGLLHSLGIEG
jgi:hypothetical protein